MGRASWTRGLAGLPPQKPMRRVLFVDDEPAALDGLRRNLTLVGRDWDMQFAAGAGHILRSLEMAPAVVVSDLRMPGIDGMGLLDSIRAMEERLRARRCYFILLTGQGVDSDAVAALRQGADDFVFKPANWQVLAARIVVGLRHLGAELRTEEALDALHAMCHTDPLTGIENRRSLSQRLEAELSRVKRGHQALSLLLIDVDHFKRVNDDYGHNAGDEVLVELARRLDASCRDYDMVGRWGGEEFVLVCPHTDAGQARIVADRVLSRISSTPVSVTGGVRIEVTVTIGTATGLPGASIDETAFVARADAALYRGKEAGRCQVVQDPGEGGDAAAG